MKKFTPQGLLPSKNLDSTSGFIPGPGTGLPSPLATDNPGGTAVEEVLKKRRDKLALHKLGIAPGDPGVY